MKKPSKMAQDRTLGQGEVKYMRGKP